MGLFPLRPMPRIADEPERPSHFEEDQNSRVPDDQGAVDYTTQVDVENVETPRPTFSTEAIPTYLVEAPPGGDSNLRWNGENFTLAPTDNGICIASNDRKRNRLKILNTSAATDVYLVNEAESGNRQGRGYLLPGGKDVEMTHNNEVWAYLLSTAGGAVTISVLTEYGIPT